MNRRFRMALFVVLIATFAHGCSSPSAEIEVGAVAPSFSLPSGERGGPVVTSASLRGQTTVLIFWSTTCSVCLKEIDELRAIHEDGDATVVAVALDDNADAVRRFLQSQKKKDREI